MTLLAKICAALAAPFLTFGAFMGGGHMATTTPHWPPITASTTASSSIGIGHWNDHPQHPAHPIKPTKPATTTPAMIQLTSLTPTSGPVGTSVTINGSGFASSSIVRFGPGAVKDVSVAANGTSLTFTIPNSISPYCKPYAACPMFAMLVTPNTYKVFVQDGTSTSTTADFTVTVTVTSTVPTPVNHPMIWANL